jgi:hypothetical protein
MGSQPPVEPYVTISRFTMLYYFYFFIIVLPFLHGLENLLWAIYANKIFILKYKNNFVKVTESENRFLLKKISKPLNTLDMRPLDLS